MLSERGKDGKGRFGQTVSECLFVQETHAQHLPEQLDAEMLTSLLREIDEEMV